MFYVDNEAVAVETLVKATRQDSRIGMLRADVREPETILEAATAIGLIDLAQPVVIVMGLLCTSYQTPMIPPVSSPGTGVASHRAVT